ncbi:GIY-YIG nuclease family protein [Escherichia coli]|nr:GIY-YIG nuclease family protein [Escherichia coli]
MDVSVVWAIIGAIIIAFGVGRYWEHKKSKEKFDKLARDLEIKTSANELLRKTEHESNENRRQREHEANLLALRYQHDAKVRELNTLISTWKNKTSDIFAKAVKYAFEFEESLSAQHQTAQKEIQAVLDDAYHFKVKTILGQVTLRNYETKFELLKKERETYKKLLADREFFKLKDNSDWPSVEKQLNDKILQLRAAQDEREAQLEIKRQMREEQQRAEELERIQREADAKERELEERRKAVEEALLAADEEHRKELEATRKELEQKIAEERSKSERAKSLAQQTRQGNVYVISNIGSFGKNVFKIGMTRRLEPMDRINELSNASVPFEFDVHALISCDDAPALENALHKELDSYRVNKVNLRKEFFATTIEKIIDCVKKHHGDIEYVADPVAIQYYRTLEMQSDESEQGGNGVPVKEGDLAQEAVTQ